MSPRRVVIADDEPLARERVRRMLEVGRAHTIVAEAGDGPAAVEAILEHRPEIVFLDIKMPGLDGLEVLTALADGVRPPAVIFVTAHDAHAVKAFEVGAVDYLLKPFDAERFAHALGRAEATLLGGRATLGAEVKALLKSLTSRLPYPERFLVRAPKHLYFVKAAEIEWAEGASNYVRLYIGGRAHLIRETLSGLSAKLPPERFVRVHRSVIVNLDQIAQLAPAGHGEYEITLKSGKRVTSSRTHNAALRALL
ncbi:MAG TPA: LytTR family DNA-binding domain-containing protein [Gemmatimonadales bacterium]|nr:LytTR family DNA-binding domain-containing protein [Gemmatimonadales bacterium]